MLNFEFTCSLAPACERIFTPSCEITSSVTPHYTFLINFHLKEAKENLRFGFHTKKDEEEEGTTRRVSQIFSELKKIRLQNENITLRAKLNYYISSSFTSMDL